MTADAAARLSTALADRYRIERELGAGGMATVYLASDLKHDRRVALKVLRPELAAVIGAARFLVEIKTTANLQHPHILSLHDSGEVDGTVFYVMPYIEGESLRDRLNRDKQLPVEEAVRIATEVAGALEYAHQHSVIHRDIKPENILLQGSHAVVADFGIALAAVRSDGGTRMTETGMSLGTPHYMSPEQAMGEREITARSDVYALGCVLYETLTGEPPFTGPTAQAIVARVMTEEPRSLTLQRRTIPRNIEAAVHTALAKLPADRFATARAFAEALADRGYGALAPAATTPPAPVRKEFATAGWVAGGVSLLALGAGFLAGRKTAPAAAQPMVQMTVEAPDSVFMSGRCCGGAMAISPDGSVLVFVGSDSRGGGGLYRRPLGALQSELIPGTEGGSVPFFSPDGNWLGFAADGKLRKVSMAGGPPVPIVEGGPFFEASWAEGDQIVYAADNRLFLVAAGGGTPRPLMAPDSTTRYQTPFALPGGRAALLSIRTRSVDLTAWRIGVVDFASGKLDTLGFGTRAAYAGGYLVFAGADRTLLAQPFDPAKRKTTGSAVAILDGLMLHGGVTHEFAVSSGGGSLAIQPAVRNGSAERLIQHGPAGRSRIDLPGTLVDNLEDPAFSPDGRRIAFRMRSDGPAGGTEDVWLLDRQQGTVERFTVGGGLYPAWSRDGRKIAYVTPAGIFSKSADQTGTPELVLKGGPFLGPAWLPDGRSLVFAAAGRGATRSDIGVVGLGDTLPRWLVATEFTERNPQVSPDGQWLAYESDRTGRPETYVQPMATEGARVQVSTEGGSSPRWSPEGRILYFVSPANAIVAAARTPGPGFSVASRKTVVDGGVTDLNGSNVNWDIHPDGKQFLYIEGGGGVSTQATWIRNWTELVKSKSGEKRP